MFFNKYLTIFIFKKILKNLNTHVLKYLILVKIIFLLLFLNTLNPRIFQFDKYRSVSKGNFKELKM